MCELRDGEGIFGRGKIWRRLTGPRSFSAVSSRTFSIADFEGSRGPGRMSVALLPFSRSPMFDVGECGCRTLEYYVQ